MAKFNFSSLDQLLSGNCNLIVEIKELLNDSDKLYDEVTTFMFMGVGIANDLRNLARGFDFSKVYEDAPDPYDHREDAEEYVLKANLLTLAVDVSELSVDATPIMEAARVVITHTPLLPSPESPDVATEALESAENLIMNAHLKALDTLARLQRIQCYKRDDTEDLARLFHPNGERDSWMRQQAESGASNSEIRRELREHLEWDQIDTDQGISQAIGRYCERNRLDRPKR